MARWFSFSLVLLLMALALPGEAQQWQVAREQFAFTGRQLTVHVDSEAEGTLRVIRGSPGLVRVSGRSDGGMTAAGLTGTRELTLTGAGPGPVDYVITVPERVWIDVRLPDRAGVHSMGGHDRAGSFHWGEARAPEAAPTAWLPPERGVGDAGYTVLAAELAPRTVALPELVQVRSVTVRVEGTRFRVGASRPLAMQRGNSDRLEIRPGAPPMDITLQVPVGTDHFLLELGGDQALIVQGDRIAVLCSPSTRQWLSGGRGWVTFSPLDSSLQCGPAAIVRHDS